MLVECFCWHEDVNAATTFHKICFLVDLLKGIKDMQKTAYFKSCTLFNYYSIFNKNHSDWCISNAKHSSCDSSISFTFPELWNKISKTAKENANAKCMKNHSILWYF